MQSVKIFFVTFLTSVCIVLFSFGFLYWQTAPSTQPADTAKTDVPMAKADSTHNKTTLVFANCETPVFLLIKLNAVDSKVSVAEISADFYIPYSRRTVSESFEYAGMMQCVEDLSAQLDIAIHHHLVLQKEDAENLCKKLSCDTAANEITAAYTAEIIKNNLTNIQSTVLADIPADFSYLSTDIGKTEAAKLAEIVALLQRTQPQYLYCTVTDAKNAPFQLKEIM